jgi:ketosteroid isomerase-like protein
MSEENVEIARRLLNVFRGRDRTADGGFTDSDFAAAAELLHPEIEWDATRVPVEDIRGIYHGLLGVAKFWEGWLEAWDTVEIDDEPELIGAGDHVFLWIENQEMRGRGSGIKVDFPPWAYVMTFRNGQVTRMVFYLDRSDALEAAGLSE